MIKHAILILILALTCAGCARTVTDKEKVFLNIQFEIEFREPIDSTKFNYFLIFSQLRLDSFFSGRYRYAPLI